MMSDKDDMAPTAREYRSMLHMLSLSKDVPRGSNWARSVELLKEAQDMEYRLTEVSFRTGEKIQQARTPEIKENMITNKTVDSHLVCEYFVV